jgi:hypothetical protein
MLSRFARSAICAASALTLGVGLSRSNYALPFARANADSASPAAAAPSPAAPKPSAAPQKNGKSEAAAAAFPFMPKSKAKSKVDGEEECEVCSDRADDFFKQINAVGKARPAAAAVRTVFKSPLCSCRIYFKDISTCFFKSVYYQFFPSLQCRSSSFA